MNLTRPITILLSRQPPSLTHNDGDDDDDDDSGDDGTVRYLSFYLPYGTSKVIHIDRLSSLSSRVLLIILVSSYLQFTDGRILLLSVDNRL